jgi:hypothetical protein
MTGVVSDSVFVFFVAGFIGSLFLVCGLLLFYCYVTNLLSYKLKAKSSFHHSNRDACTSDAAGVPACWINGRN